MHPDTLTLEQARTRLEGVVERLEAAGPILLGARELLASPRWRTELLERPTALDATTEAAATLDDDLTSARRLLGRETCSALAALVQGVADEKASLEALALDHAGGAAGPLQALLRAANAKARAELPLPVQVGESVVAATRFARLGWVGVLAACGGFLAAGAYVVMHSGSAELVWAAGMGGALLSASATQTLTRNANGDVVLTTRRLIHRPRRADPIEIPLAELTPGSVRARPVLRGIDLAAPRPLRIRGVAGAQALAGAIELERWLLSRSPGPPDAEPRCPLLLLPYRAGSNTTLPLRCLLLSPAGYSILPGLPDTDQRYGLGTYLAGKLWTALTLEQLRGALQRLSPVQVAEELPKLARALRGTYRPIRRLYRKHGYTNLAGFEADGRIWGFEPTGYREALALEAMLEGWEVVEADDRTWSYP